MKQQTTMDMDRFSKFFCVIFALVILFVFSFGVSAQTNPADINNDGYVDVRDIVSMKRKIAEVSSSSSSSSPFDNFNDSSDNSSNYNSVDLANLISFVIGATDSFEKSSGTTIIDF